MSHFSKLSPLQLHRLNFKPKLPSILDNLKNLIPTIDNGPPTCDPIASLFPHTADMPLISFSKGNESPARALKIGIVFSGGQAPGGHNVIAGVFDALNELHPDSQLIGFLDGPNGIIQNQAIHLTHEVIAPFRNQGGFDLIGSGRTKFETLAQYEAAEKTVCIHRLDGLIIIGGDDSNTNAAHLAEHFKAKGLSTCVAGVPKTIDGDLKNDFIEISFGFDTACKIYSEIIGNIAKDALSAKKYYFFVKLMGRSASHITLECALNTQVNLALIGEEIRNQKQSTMDVVNHIADMICARAAVDKHYGVILIPEGVIEFLDDFDRLIQELNQLNHSHHELSKLGFSAQLEYVLCTLQTDSLELFHRLPDSIKTQLFLDRDPHGNIQVSKIETERLLINLVEEELKKRTAEGHYRGKFNPQAMFCGYEGRTGLPSNFDCQYCYSLGYVAALLIHSGSSGYMGCLKQLDEPVENWQVQAVPLTKMLNMETRKGKKAAVLQKSLVNLEGKVFNAFKNKRQQWLIEDHYLCPGPIQFHGPTELTDLLPLTLLMEKESKN